MAFLSHAGIEKMGFKHVGREVKLSDRASFHNPGAIEIGDFSRIDDFCILSAGQEGIKIGRNVHIAAYTSLIGAGRILLEDFCNLSSRVSVYSSNDDYSGAFMTNPTVASQFTGVTHAPVTIGRHAIVGSGSIVLPGVMIGEGAALGALSLANRNCDAFVMYAGIPAKPIGERRRDLLQHERDFLAGERQ
jgi:acetyltransferase-like isoleucine patch superfamily enzyme